MRQPGDVLTMELPGLPTRRGRGRPRKPDALTPAQRAKRYRDRQKAAAAARAAAARPWIKYRGPNGETWTGRGLMPRWVSAALERGYTLAQLQALADART